ncbi:glycine cleavage system H protein, putative [Trypanosoma brucei gambiense DAL972]|uniref:Glycine cleavage system H protein n=2 Tax=Trypanosoma brucei TaxID=5691 RepID=C9ZYJ1_TRYB9|nr:glycine cleavage system H protein, putative [Trypanosoma brucei gambiense DAL972]RHW70478.1 lipoic acid containing carrier protein [Trypanosoma brucei equiperdum]CBH14490.1 glycine cleavage system H protein, putative [Trypanosoma brucei gambiense DAL972]|eukprot:XP_011776756.1 glycine cleavage system H protein, putative [Trypanosoma brucei gambiense DAL972]
MRRALFCPAATVAATIRFYATRFFTDSHEWVEHGDGIATIGITAHAQENLGDVVYVALPNVGDKITERDMLGEVESVKATSNVYCPVTGVVHAVNEKVKDEPSLINRSAEADGWLVKVKCDEIPKGLMTADEYNKFIE